jgi:hypothetical protein
MRAYKAYVPDSELDHLQQLVGRDIGDIFSPALEVHDEYIVTFGLSLTLEWGKSFLDFHNKWLSTERGTHYWQFSIMRSDTPRNLEWEVLDRDRWKFEFRASRISLPKVWYMSTVEVYETELILEENGESEAEILQYDSAIVCYQHAGRRFCISPAGLTANLLRLSLDDDQINKQIRRRKLRWSSSGNADAHNVLRISVGRGGSGATEEDEAATQFSVGLSRG